MRKIDYKSHHGVASGLPEKLNIFKSIFRFLFKIIIRIFYNYKSDGSFPEEFRKTLSRLGPAYVKLGQMLSLRSDLLPESITQELSKLQNHVPAFEFSSVKEIIETEFKKSISELFLNFNEEPIAAGSLGQVHLAELKSGKEVAVKVQRPNITKLIFQDISIIRRFLLLFEKWGNLRHYKLTEFIDEFKTAISVELDFEQEGRNLDQFRKKFSKQRHVVFPKVFWKYTSKKVLTMQYIEGINLEKGGSLQEKGINTKRLSYLGTRSILKMLFIDGFFHADPHPGNILVIGRSRLCFLDAGMVGYLSDKVKSNFLLYLYLLITGKYEQATKYLLKLTTYGESSNIIGFENEVIRMLRNWYLSSFNDYTVGKLTLNVMQCAAKYRLSFRSELILAARAVLTAESVGRLINPDIQVHLVIQPMIQRFFNDFINPEAILKELASSWPEYLISLRSLPKNMINFLELVGSNRIPVESWGPSNNFNTGGSLNKYFYLPVLSAASMISGTIALTSSSTPGPFLQLMANSPKVSSLSLGFFSLSIFFMLNYFSRRNNK